MSALRFRTDGYRVSEMEILPVWLICEPGVKIGCWRNTYHDEMPGALLVHALAIIKWPDTIDSAGIVC